ncbi:PAS domain-containing protein [Archangium violaceum]|uniref:sensor histidine kinase n=1 Tax=Archangium violaceum TaxID=83451 RepID=UPI00194E932B|nr:ATP-binding protein [Archangium violaceum]QRN93751.1 PAS domain-containing protein [Archangium violaceum]
MGESPHKESLTLQLEAAEERLRVVLGLTDSLVFEIDADGRYLSVLTQSDELLAVPREEMMGRTLVEVLGPEIAAPFMERIQYVLTTGQPDRFEYSLEIAGTRRWFSADGMMVPQRASVAFLVRDVTQQKSLELRLLQADRLAALGTMAAGVSHEVSSPLSYIRSNLRFIAEGLAELRQVLSGAEGIPDRPRMERTLEECEEALTEAQQGTERIHHVVGDLKTFARGEDADSLEGQVDVRRALETSINMAMPELKHRARVLRYLQPVPPVRGSESRLGQVFLNLLLNAAQAISEGAPDKNAVEIRLWAEDGQVVSEIHDTGQGISPENLKRIFDPFFTTKPAGVGTGLGLAICQGIVTAMQGEISVLSTVGKGTCFRVVLPVAPSTETGD